MMDTLNEWIPCEVIITEGSNLDQTQEAFQDALAYKSHQESRKIKDGTFGAIGTEDGEGFYLVQWKSSVYTLQEDTVAFGSAAPYPAGDEVAEAIIWKKIDSNPGWYQPPDYTGPQDQYIDIIWLGHVIKGEVAVRRCNQDKGIYPKKPSFIAQHNRNYNSSGLRQVFPSQLELIQTEIKARDGLEYCQWDVQEVPANTCADEMIVDTKS